MMTDSTRMEGKKFITIMMLEWFSMCQKYNKMFPQCILCVWENILKCKNVTNANSIFLSLLLGGWMGLVPISKMWDKGGSPPWRNANQVILGVATLE